MSQLQRFVLYYIAGQGKSSLACFISEVDSISTKIPAVAILCYFISSFFFLLPDRPVVFDVAYCVRFNLRMQRQCATS